MLTGSAPIFRHWYLYATKGNIVISPETPMSWYDYRDNVVIPGMNGQVIKLEYLGSELVREVKLMDQTKMTVFV